MKKYKCPICKEESKYKGICFKCENKYNYYNYYAILKNEITNDLEYSYKEILSFKDVYEKVKKHIEKLEKNRKYHKGEQIKNLDELLKQQYVYFFSSIRHIEVIKSLQLRFVLNALEINIFHFAIKKENDNAKNI